MGKQKFKTGSVDIPAEEFDRKHLKIRISMMMDADILDAYREAAKSTPHGEYQTLMKEALRAYLRQSSSFASFEERLARLEAQVKEAILPRVIVVPFLSIGGPAQVYPIAPAQPQLEKAATG